MPQYIRWGDCYYDWLYLRATCKNQAINKNSYSQCAQTYKRTIYSHNNDNFGTIAAATGINDDIEWFTSSKLKNACFFSYILWVCYIHCLTFESDFLIVIFLILSALV